jgi:hypothetical protein
MGPDRPHSGCPSMMRLVIIAGTTIVPHRRERSIGREDAA